MNTNIPQVQVDWEFIGTWYPNYDGCDDVLETDIIQKYIDGELVEGDVNDKEDWDWVKSLGDDEDIILYMNSKSMALLDYAMDAYIEHKTEEAKKKEFSIPLVRMSYGYKNVVVKASSLEEAERTALEMAGDLEYNEKDAEYKLDDF